MLKNHKAFILIKMFHLPLIIYLKKVNKLQIFSHHCSLTEVIATNCGLQHKYFSNF